MPVLRGLGRFGARRLGALVSSADARRYGFRHPPHPYVAAPADAWWSGEPRWFTDDAPPRRHNQIHHLVDGERYFAALVEAIERAEHYVYLADWCLTPTMPLARGDDRQLIESQVARVLQVAARRIPVRVLLWSGARALFQPDLLTMLAFQEELQRLDGDFQCRLDYTAIATHCHHQKAVVVDGRVAFVGGIDLTTLAGDRWDTPTHALRNGPNWHDVQVRIEGDAVHDVETNFRQRWEAATGGAALPPRQAPAPMGDTPLQIVRTIHDNTYRFAPQGIHGIGHAYLEVIRRATRVVYIENQYLWSEHVLNELIRLVQHPPSPDFRIVIVLPLYADDGKWDNDRHVALLRAADPAGSVVSVYAIYSSGPAAGRRAFLYRPIYVHAKVAIVDDEWTLVGSANINLRGFHNDSELDALIHDPAFARSLRVRLWAEHLGLPEAAVAADSPHTVVDQRWKPQAERNERIIAAADRPLEGAAVRYHIGRTPGAWLLEALEALTLER